MAKSINRMVLGLITGSMLFGLFLLPSPSPAAENLTVTFSVFPPLHNANALANPDNQGALVEFYKKVFPTLGYNVRLLQLPPKRIGILMDKGETVDVYSCATRTLKNRPHYAFGPPFTRVTIQLFQNARLPALNSIEDVRNSVIIKQHGFVSLKRLLDSSNSYLDAHSSSVVAMFARGRADYLLDFKERSEAMITKERNMPKYREYPIRVLRGHICLNKRFKNAQERVNKMHVAMLDFQDSPEGQRILRKYGYTGRFGDHFDTASEN